MHSRIEAGTLKIIGSACPNLVFESELYQCEPGCGNPAKEYDHALDALRYLIFKLDAKRLAKKKWFWQRNGKADGGGAEAGGEDGDGKKVERPWLSVWNEELWRRIC